MGDGRQGWRIDGTSPAAEELRRALDRVASTRVPVLLYGETGTGKRHAARVLHGLAGDGELRWASGRDEEGIRRAVAQGGRGTLVVTGLDEAPARVQGLLLGWLEAADDEGPWRWVFTARSDLEDRVNAGRFRRDLYYLVAGFPLRVPPLRERLEDLPALIEGLVRRRWPEAEVPEPHPAFLREAIDYDWPGNVRELEALVVASFPPSPDCPWPPAPATRARADRPEILPFAEAKRRFERDYVARLLLATEGNVARAARLAGKARKDFYILMERTGLRPDRFRPRRWAR
ncbi:MULTISPECIES: DNA-binding transcriptional response regulator [Deferrisoma]